MKLAKKGISTFDSTKYKSFEWIFLSNLKYDQQNLESFYVLWPPQMTNHMTKEFVFNVFTEISNESIFFAFRTLLCMIIEELNAIEYVKPKMLL